MGRARKAGGGPGPDVSRWRLPPWSTDKGKVELDWRKNGFFCRVALPLANAGSAQGLSSGLPEPVD